MNWDTLDVKKELSLGEDSTRQFKVTADRASRLAEEFCAFSNSSGGMLYIGVNDDGEIVGLTDEARGKINQLIGNASNENVRPAVYTTTKVFEIDGKRIIAVHVPSGPTKPYCTSSGEYYVKSGSDKKLASPQELLRLFQQSALFHLDESNTTASTDETDLAKFYVFFEKLKEIEFSKAEVSIIQALQNMNLAKEGNLTLAGLLLFGKNPQKFKPFCIIRAVSYNGNNISDEQFFDRADLAGTLKDQYDGAMLFLKKNLRTVQVGKEFNQSGSLEIDERALSEAVVNALVHRDYSKNAPVRLLIFNDRIEIISPGSLPNHLTVENITNGNTVHRNPLISSYALKVLPYSGLGSGILRILKYHPDTTLVDDKNGEQFTIILKRSVQ